MRRSVSWTAAAATVILALHLARHARGADAKPQTELERAPSLAAVQAPKPVLRHGVFKHTSYPAAWTSAQQSHRPILVFATSTNCPHCTRMIGETYRSPQVSRFLNDSFETVYVSRTEQPELAAKLKVRLFPTTIVVGPDNQVLDVIEGYVDSKTFAQRLQTTVAAHTEATQTR